MRKIFFVTIPAILIFLIAMELCLRLGGYLYVQSHHPETHAKAAEFSKDEFRILCLGDSFTFGMGADPESSYPKQLEKILQKNISPKIHVINEGRLGNTSSLVLKKMPADINQYSPSIIIVMIGTNNPWNLEDSSYFLLYGSGASFFERLEKALGSLRIYKLFKIGCLNLRSKKDVDQKIVTDNGSSRKINGRVNELISIAGNLYREGKNDLAVEKTKEALKIDDTDPSAHFMLAQVLSARGDRQSAKEELRQFINLFKEWDLNSVGIMVALLEINGTNEDLIFFKKHLRENVEKKKSDVLIEMAEATLDMRENEKKFREVLDYDLGQIVGLAKKKGIKVIVMTYPTIGWNKDLSNVIIKASQKYHTCFTDNEMPFKGKSRSEFFVTDGHCNGKGYGLMAENIYEVLVKNGMLPAGSAGVRGDGR